MILRRPARRLAFAVYALLLFVATHWPALKIEAPGRPDLYIHAAVFFGWTALLILAGFFGPVLSLRNILIAAAIGPAYAAIDEGLQAVPFIRRHAAFDDWAANCLGVAIAILAALALRYLHHHRRPARLRLPLPPNLAAHDF